MCSRIETLIQSPPAIFYSGNSFYLTCNILAFMPSPKYSQIKPKNATLCYLIYGYSPRLSIAPLALLLDLADEKTLPAHLHIDPAVGTILLCRLHAITDPCPVCECQSADSGDLLQRQISGGSRRLAHPRKPIAPVSTSRRLARCDYRPANPAT